MAEAVTNVAIQPTGLRIRGRKLGVGECAQQREDAAYYPDQERKADGAVDLAKNRARRSKNPGADDGADEEQQKIAKPKCANQFWHWCAAATRRASRCEES